MTETRIVNGCRSDSYKLWRVPIEVRYTADELGKSMSFTCYDKGDPVQLMIPLEPIEDLLEGENHD